MLSSAALKWRNVYLIHARGIIDQKSDISPHFWPVLAGCRFLLALWVLFDHTYNFGQAEKAIPVLTKSGQMAVMCFFVISGFSIHHSLASKPHGYYHRRFWRIFPMNALMVAIGWLAWSVFGITGGYGTPQVAPSFLHFLGCLLFLEVALPVMVPFFFPAWSLSIEALYYACAPWLQRCRAYYLNGIIVASCLFFIVWPYLRNTYIAGGYSYPFAAIGLVWTWLMGWVAYQYPRHRWYLVLAILGGVLSLITQAKYYAIVDVASAAGNVVPWLAVLLIVFFRAGRITGKPAAFLNYLGEISFPLYILHYPVLFIMTSTLLKTHPEYNTGIVQVTIALAAAVVAFHGVDTPLRRYFTRALHHGSGA